ncbi:MAG TPA: hypothetical protein PKO25_00500 [Spirochaetota bacterium]|jgi:hypothetical protein|nr:hypothetical protein [Spirochaetota bacterium]HNU90337.1 hypothetical protein [Spirochaetota bacterium]HPV96460.1 hypothetical protein [Spirochaetota bacterium]
MERTKRACCALLLVLTVSAAETACKKKERNEVPLEQIEIDGSTDYRYIFRDTIDREAEESRKGKKDPFAGSR